MTRASPDRRPACKLDDGKWREALALHNKGLSWARIAPSFGVSARVLSKRYQYETGQHSKPQRRRISPETLDQMLNMRAAGASVREIEMATGFATFAVQDALRTAREEGDPRAAYRDGARGADVDSHCVEDVQDVADPAPGWQASRVYLSMRGKVGHAAALEHMAYLARREQRA